MGLEILELTPPGAGGVSVVQVVGQGAFERVREMAPRARADVRVPQLVRLRVAGEDLDEALVCVLSPVEVELHVHGSPPLVRRLLEFLGRQPGAAPGGGDAARVTPVAASVRSVEARARERLSRAVSDSGARILLDQAEGALRRALLALRSAGEERSARIEELLERGRVARFALEPAEVVLAGAVNAGKSTLFNLLLGENRVIVSDEEGTTRDVVRERAQLGAYPIFLSDSAGWRASAAAELDDGLERASQLHALRARRQADLILWLARADTAGSRLVQAHSDPVLDSHPEGAQPGDFDPRREASGSAGLGWTEARSEVVYTQMDRLDGAQHVRFSGGISALRAPDAARARIREIFHAVFELPDEPWSAGSAVPFDPQLMNGLKLLRRESSRADWEAALERLLDGS